MWQRLVRAPGGRVGAWVTLAVWLVLAVPGAMLAGRVGGVQDNNPQNWLPAHAGSTRALQLAQREFPAPEGMPLVVVYARPGGVTAADRAAAEADRAALAGLAIATPAPVAASPDGRALLLDLTLPADDAATGRLVDAVHRARAAVAGGLPAGLVARLTGPAAARADATAANTSLNTTFLLATVGTVGLLLLAIYRSPLLPLLTLLPVGVVAVLANAVVYLLAAHAGLVVTGSDETLLTVLVFGAGTDYALLLIARYREELYRHADRYAAMARALHRTVPTIVASATTVVLALLTLLAAEMNSTRGLGPVAAVGIGTALLALTTLLPAVLVCCGRRVPFWPVVPRYRAGAPDGAAAGGHRAWTRIAARVGRRPRALWLGTALVLALAALGTLSLRVGGLSAADNFTRVPDSVRGQQLLAAHFPAGTGAPLDVYVPAAQADPAAATVRGTPGVAGVDAAQRSRSGRWVRLPVVLADPPTGTAAQRTVVRLRAALARLPGTPALVGGDAAAALDQNQAMRRDLWLIVPLALVVVLAVLIALLRAVVAAVLLLGCVVLSFGAALGTASLIFNALGYPRTDPALLLIGFLFLTALGVDYTIFLAARIREDAGRYGHREGVRHGLAVTGGVITSAGLVLAATFTVLTATPVVLNLQIGLLVAVGVLLDTLVVRTLLVPALALATGPRFWWPARVG